MASITTTGTNNDPVTTTQNANETVPEWLARHKQAIDNAGVSGSNSLTSKWGDECSAETERPNGQTDADFVNSHMLDVGTEMVSCPP